MPTVGYDKQMNAHRPVSRLEQPARGSIVHALLARAQSVLHQPFARTFSEVHHGSTLEAYCAAYVRWCFDGVGIALPVVGNPEFYRRFGIRFVGGLYTADGLAGSDVGDLVTGEARAGDIVLYRNTFGNYPYGTITHVGIASLSPGMIYDAGSGSIVHHRSIDRTFKGPVVEVRRPRALGGAPGRPGYHPDEIPTRVADQCTRLVFRHGSVSVKLRGKAVGALSVMISRDGKVVVNGQAGTPELISAVIIDTTGKSYKMFKHHGTCSMTDGVAALWFSFSNGLLEVGRSTGTGTHVNLRRGRVEDEITGIKPASVELTIDH